MTTTEKVKEMKGLKDLFIFGKIGISKYAFTQKVNGKVEWKESEIQEIDRLYKIYQKF